MVPGIAGKLEYRTGFDLLEPLTSLSRLDECLNPRYGRRVSFNCSSRMNASTRASTFSRMFR